ncbi:hypothetical protein [Succinimonas amylolytica]|uniref:hypothetical protein n=1 Tax=Succinimonas amylolytica TaxID=83769 RepID=UPI0023A8B992
MKKLLSAWAMILGSCLAPGCFAGDYDARLAGTWVGVSPEPATPNLVLEFSGDQTVTIRNLLEEPVTVRYEISDRPYMTNPEKGGFSIRYTHYYQKRSLGVLLNTSFTQELYYHVENGLPILSETGFEHDGCGFMIRDEYLPEGRGQAGFESELSKKVNAHCDRHAPRGR